jgi:hypothetical protein
MVASACPESDFPQLEVGEELVPFLDREVTVLIAGPFGPAARDERPVMRDDVFGVDRGISHRGVHSGVAAHLGRDVWGQPGADGVGDEDPPEIVGVPVQRLAAGPDGTPSGCTRTAAGTASGCT